MAPEVRSRKIKNSKFLEPKKSKNTVCNKEWTKSITDETSKAVIPVASYFQADVPDWNDQIRKNYSDESKWLRSVVWQPSYATRTIVEEEGNTIGKGRPDSCLCTFPGSTECVKLHVRIKHNQLRSDLGPAYYKWRFYEMGEVGRRKSWDFDERKTINALARTCNMKSKHTSFLDLVSVHFPAKCRKNVVSYYFNVYVPRRISTKIRSGALEVDSDED